MLHADNRIEPAAILYDEVLRLQPSHIGAKSNLATALHALGRLGDAGSVYAQAVDDSPNNAVLLSNYAIYLNDVKRYEQALDVLNKALAIEPVTDDTLATRDALVPQLQREIDNMKICKNTAIELVQQAKWDEVISALTSCGEPAENAAWWFAIAGWTQHMRYAHCMASIRQIRAIVFIEKKFYLRMCLTCILHRVRNH